MEILIGRTLEKRKALKSDVAESCRELQKSVCLENSPLVRTLINRNETRRKCLGLTSMQMKQYRKGCALLKEFLAGSQRLDRRLLEICLPL